jgi:hypothetical protein
MRITDGSWPEESIAPRYRAAHQDPRHQGDELFIADRARPPQEIVRLSANQLD